jgi:hypothetical protein
MLVLGTCLTGSGRIFELSSVSAPTPSRETLPLDPVDEMDGDKEQGTSTLSNQLAVLGSNT